LEEQCQKARILPKSICTLWFLQLFIIFAHQIRKLDEVQTFSFDLQKFSKIQGTPV
jgi:hypothetical protein